MKYDSVDWLNQSFATKVENVNPFHVIEYNGIVRLNPNRDNWVRTIRLAPRTVQRTMNVEREDEQFEDHVEELDLIEE